MAAEIGEFADCLIEERLQLLELGESAGDIGLDPSPPAMPEPEFEAAKLECVRSQLAQGNPNGAAGRGAIAEKRAGNEIVGAHSQPTSHRSQQRVWKTLQNPRYGHGERSVHASRGREKLRRANTS